MRDRDGDSNTAVHKTYVYAATPQNAGVALFYHFSDSWKSQLIWINYQLPDQCLDGTESHKKGILMFFSAISVYVLRCFLAKPHPLFWP